MMKVHSTLPITKKKYVEILLNYRQLFIKGDVIIGDWGIFGVEIFLCYGRYFIKDDFVIGRVECKPLYLDTNASAVGVGASLL